MTVEPSRFELQIQSGLHAGAVETLPEGRHRIGSDIEADIVLVEDGIAPIHVAIGLSGRFARIEALSDGVTIDGRGPLAVACGQNRRALALLRLVARERPDDVALLRVFAYALLAAGEGEIALTVVERLEALDGTAQSGTLLLRSHALRLAGRLDDARQCFRDFVAVRREEGA
jgi:hypothetical protein